MSKIEAGHVIDLFIEDGVDIADEINEVATTCTALLEGKPVELVLEIPGDLPRMAVDRRRIRQVMLNLTSNAANFTDAGKIKLSARLDKEQLIIAVEDTGPGIPVEKQSIIFEPFYQLGQARGAKPAGTGLGLAISKRLAEAHGGKLWLESTPGQGSTFYLSLPLETAGHKESQKS
jgi:two-component system phosphate regulon sensor histidine kinase PhoR